MAKQQREFYQSNATEMRAAIRLRYGASAAVFDEVGNGTGSRCSRHADCVAMGLWPSRGLHLEGIEIKVSRSDWLHELRSPEKADAIAKFCDFWWLAIGDASIVQEGELPANWGLLVLAGDKLKTVKQAPKLDAAPLDRPFIAALLRRAADAHEDVRRHALIEGYKNGEAAAAKPRDTTAAEIELTRLRQSLAEFETKSGIKINEWGIGHVAETVARIRKLNGWRQRREDPGLLIERAATDLERHVKDLRDEAKNIKREMKLAAGVPLDDVEAEEAKVANG